MATLYLDRWHVDGRAVVLGDAWWGVPLCLLGFWMPTHYARWRARAHAAGRLRCDWLPVLTSATVRR